MSFRTTTLLFGILLAVLWSFGLLLALKKSELDQGLVLHRFAQKTKDAAIESVEIAKKDGTKLVFTRSADGKWLLNVPPHKQQVRVIDNNVENLIDELRRARHSNDKVPELTRNLEQWELANPKMTVTLQTKTGGEAKVFVGKESGDGSFIFVNSTDRPDDVLAIERSALSSLFLDVDKFRSTTLIDIINKSATALDLKENKDNKISVLALKKLKEKQWQLVQPPLGPADFEGGASVADKFDKFDKIDKGEKKDTNRGVNSLLRTVTNLQAEEFEPFGSTITVDADKALLRIEVDFGDPEDKKTSKQVLLIGDKVRDKDQYFARMDGEGVDKSVVRVGSKQLESVFALIKDPRPLRSHDISFISLDGVDAVKIQRGKEFVDLYKEKNAWDVFSSDGKPKAGSDSAIMGPGGVLPGIQGKQAIGDKDFEDTDTADKIKALEAKFAPDKLDAKVTVFADSLLPPPEKKEEKKDDKKDDKKSDAKDEKKDTKADDKKDAPKTDSDDDLRAISLARAGQDKKADEKKDDKVAEQKSDKKDDKKADAKDDKGADQKSDKKSDDKKAEEKKDDKKADQKDDKKDDKQADKTPPKFKEGARPIVTLSFVKLDKEKVLVKRELPVDEGKDDKDKKDEIKIATTYFTISTSAYEKIVPKEMALALFDTKLKTFAEPDAVKLDLSRAPLKDRDKMMENFVLALEKVTDKDKDKEKDKAKDDTGKKDEAKDADKKKDEAKKVEEPKKDDQKKDADAKKDTPDADKKDADKKKDGPEKTEWKLLEPKEFVGKGRLETIEVERVLDALSELSAVRWVQKASPESLTHYGLDDKHWTVRVSVTPKKKEGDKEDPKPFILRLGEASNRETDKGAVFAYQEGSDFVFLVDKGIEKLLKEAEFRDRHVLKFEPLKVKELRVFVTTAEKEVRKPVFERDADKSWKDKKEVLGFKLDSRRVDDLLDKLSDLQVVRYLAVKGELPKEYELGDAAPLKFEVLMDDDKTVHTITVGATSEKDGPYYATCSSLPGHVFLLGRDPFSELMGKVTYFRKD